MSCTSAALCVAVDIDGDVLSSTDPTGGVSAWSAAHVYGGSLHSVSCPSVLFCVATGGGDVLTRWTRRVGRAPGRARISTTRRPAAATMSLVPPSCSMSRARPRSYASAPTTPGKHSAPPTLAVARPPWKTLASNGGQIQIPSGPVTCTPGPLCLAPGGGGVLVSTDPLGGDTWTAREIDGQNRLSAIACPSRQWCLAVDDAGNAVTLGPSGFSNARIDPAIPVGAPIVLPQAVACPGASLCIAVGGFGDVLASRDPTAGPTAWSRFSYGSNHGLGAVSCPTTSFCAALGYFGDVATTTNPSGGATAWTITSIVPRCRVGSCGDLTSLACPSPTLCVAASDQGKLFVSRNPISGARTWRAFRLWNPRKYVSDAIALACPSIALCVGTDFQGHVFTSIYPTRRPRGLEGHGLGAAHPLGGISCPFISLCVAPALDSSDLPTNTVYISRNPTGGRSAWSTQQIPIQLGALACATRTRCLGIGGESISTASVQPFSIAREIRARLREDLAPPKNQEPDRLSTPPDRLPLHGPAHRRHTDGQLVRQSVADRAGSNHLQPRRHQPDHPQAHPPWPPSALTPTRALPQRSRQLHPHSDRSAPRPQDAHLRHLVSERQTHSRCKAPDRWGWSK